MMGAGFSGSERAPRQNTLRVSDTSGKRFGGKKKRTRNAPEFRFAVRRSKIQIQVDLSP